MEGPHFFGKGKGRVADNIAKIVAAGITFGAGGAEAKNIQQYASTPSTFEENLIRSTQEEMKQNEAAEIEAVKLLTRISQREAFERDSNGVPLRQGEHNKQVYARINGQIRVYIEKYPAYLNPTPAQKLLNTISNIDGWVDDDVHAHTINFIKFMVVAHPSVVK
ncbi:hypothetical protein HZC00_01815 [Candidatus Kaiserbacteria bacterium]|nr:hypothetical protein [Candidatus Kaiserbacteria bacterium]